MQESQRNFKIYDENKLEMRVRVQVGESPTSSQVNIDYFTADGEPCLWAGNVARFIYQDSTEKTFVGYFGDFSFDEYQRSIKYVELAYSVSQLPLDTILNKRKEINLLILDMIFPN